MWTENQEKLVSLGILVQGGIPELPAYKVHLVKKERKVTKGQLEYRGQKDLKVSRASEVFQDLLEKKALVVIQENVEQKVSRVMLEILGLACLVSVGMLANLEEKEKLEKMEKREKKETLDNRDLQDPLGHQEMQVPKAIKETRELQVKPQLSKGKRVNLVQTAPMVWMGLMEKRAKEVPPDLQEMLELQAPKVTKEILVKMVALVFLVRWVLLDSPGIQDRKETEVQLAQLEFKGIQVLRAFQAPQVTQVMSGLQVKLELMETQD